MASFIGLAFPSIFSKMHFFVILSASILLWRISSLLLFLKHILSSFLFWSFYSSGNANVEVVSSQRILCVSSSGLSVASFKRKLHLGFGMDSFWGKVIDSSLTSSDLLLVLFTDISSVELLSMEDWLDLF